MAATFEVKKHNFVPKHTKLNEVETKEILERFNIVKRKLPKISKKDPTIKDLGLEVGDVLKISRKSPTAGESTYYRVVANV